MTKLYVDINLDPTTFPLGNYNIVVDNGGRFNGYMLNTNIGQDIVDDDMAVSYEETLVIPPLSSIDPNQIVTMSDVPHYNGKFGWENATALDPYGQGLLIASGSFGSGVPGQKPYNTTLPLVIVNIAVEGWYMFDLNFTYTGTEATIPVLYMIDTSTSRIIRGAYAGTNQYARIVVYLQSGQYNLVPTSQYNNPSITGLTYNIYATGLQYGTLIESLEVGYSQGFPVDSAFTFEIGIFKITFKNLERESTVNITFCDHNLNELSIVLPSLIYLAPGSQLVPEMMEQSSYTFRVLLAVSNDCCFARKISLDNQTVCAIPNVNKVTTSYNSGTTGIEISFVNKYTINFDA